MPSALLDVVIKDALVRIPTAKSSWSIVYGPAAALVATTARLGWKVLSPTLLIDDRGRDINLTLDSPAIVEDWVCESVTRWRWKRVESKRQT